MGTCGSFIEAVIILIFSLNFTNVDDQTNKLLILLIKQTNFLNNTEHFFILFRGLDTKDEIFNFIWKTYWLSIWSMLNIYFTNPFGLNHELCILLPSMAKWTWYTICTFCFIITISSCLFGYYCCKSFNQSFV